MEEAEDKVLTAAEKRRAAIQSDWEVHRKYKAEREEQDRLVRSHRQETQNLRSRVYDMQRHAKNWQRVTAQPAVRSGESTSCTTSPSPARAAT